MPKPRSQKPLVDYPLKRIPAEVWNAAQDKCEMHVPALNMRYVIIELIKRWIADGKPMRAPNPVFRQPKALTSPKKEAKARTRRIRETVVNDPTPPAPVVPDLGDSF